MSYGPCLVNKYISYDANNIILRAEQRKKEIQEIFTTMLNTLDKINFSSFINLSQRSSIKDLYEIIKYYSKYILNLISKYDDDGFIRNYYNVLLMNKLIHNILEFYIDLNNDPHIKYLNKIDDVIEDIGVLIDSEEQIINLGL